MKTKVSKLVAVMAVLGMVVAGLAACATPAPPPPPADTPVPGETPEPTTPPPPPPPEEVTITWATIAGFYTDWAEEVATQFEAETGWNVEVVDIDFSQLYEKQVIEMVGGTGAYDIITYDVGWKAEFANSGYLLALDDYIAASDPEEIQFEDIHPALIEASCNWKGNTWGLPFYTFTMGYFYRCDLFEDPGEMAAFEAEYGYPLDVPQTYDQLADIAEFFRREPGGTLKGEAVTEDFYGIGLMAGRFPHVQDEFMSIAWTMDQDLIKDDGTPGTTEPGFLEAAHLYVDELLPYAPPGALTSAYDEVVGQMRAGLIAQTAAFYLDQWPNMVKAEDEVPGAEICAATSPGAHTWVGALTLGMTADGKHPDETWEFLKWITGPEAQRKFAEGGGSTCRVSILTDEEFLEGRRLAAGHFPPLMEVLDHAAECGFYPNYYYVPQGGKIYDEETAWFSSAASGEYSVEDAMANLAEAIERHCAGPCEIPNDHLGADYSPVPCPYTFDKSVQIRK
ncbi:MAG: sugar ABC transporter substrate-binding protein [Anaerolineae bacterium]